VAEKQEEHELPGRDLAELGESSEISGETLERATREPEERLLQRANDKLLKKTSVTNDQKRRAAILH
jgi:hypothetical protein